MIALIRYSIAKIRLDFSYKKFKLFSLQKGNLTMEMIQDEKIVPLAALIPSGEYKLSSRIYNEKNQTIYETSSYYTLKNDKI
jgi:hypothetical protein